MRYIKSILFVLLICLLQTVDLSAQASVVVDMTDFVPSIPTAGHWGIASLCLTFLSIGLLGVDPRENSSVEQ